MNTGSLRSVTVRGGHGANCSVTVEVRTPDGLATIELVGARWEQEWEEAGPGANGDGKRVLVRERLVLTGQVINVEGP